jgi:tripartite-type tricarboxylate transporter receptor subunit TctC
MFAKQGEPSRHRRGYAFALALAFAGLASSFAAPAALAQAFPSKPITIIVPFPAGGTTDILARLLGQYMSTAMGQPVVIDNRAGAGGNIGGQAAARAPADGYTLFREPSARTRSIRASTRRCRSTT